jgi:hypothetical protein
MLDRSRDERPCNIRPVWKLAGGWATVVGSAPCRPVALTSITLPSTCGLLRCVPHVVNLARDVRVMPHHHIGAGVAEQVGDVEADSCARLAGKSIAVGFRLI